jgi:hypothetical protein
VLVTDVLAAIAGCNTASGLKILVVDQPSMRIINSFCRMFDIVEKGVTGTQCFGSSLPFTAHVL